MAEIRLQKFLAAAGVASRRKCEELILQGRVEVNGHPVLELGTKVLEEDEVKVDRKPVQPEERKVYIVLNKPVGFVTTAKDQFARRTVLDLVDGVRERIYPVGRLDYDTSGLLLLTNDGDLAFQLTHPGHEVRKVYQAKVTGTISEQDIQDFRRGILIENAKTAPARLQVLEVMADRSLVEIEIHEGRNRQVRKMCEAVGHPVLSLKRVAVGSLTLGDLAEGQWRHLTVTEIDKLMHRN